MLGSFNFLRWRGGGSAGHDFLANFPTSINKEDHLPPPESVYQAVEEREVPDTEPIQTCLLPMYTLPGRAQGQPGRSWTSLGKGLALSSLAEDWAKLGHTYLLSGSGPSQGRVWQAGTQ